MWRYQHANIHLRALIFGDSVVKLLCVYAHDKWLFAQVALNSAGFERQVDEKQDLEMQAKTEEKEMDKGEK